MVKADLVGMLGTYMRLVVNNIEVKATWLGYNKAILTDSPRYRSVS